MRRSDRRRQRRRRHRVRDQRRQHTGRPSPGGNARSASRSLAGAEASNGASAITGSESPRIVSLRGCGQPLDLLRRAPDRRSARAAPRPAASTRMMPMPRTSISPAIVAGARTRMASPSRAQLALIVGDEPGAGVNQSQREIGLAGPRRAAQQHRAAVDRDRRCAWTSSGSAHRARAGRRIRKRAPQTSPLRVVPVLGPDAAAMRLDDLLRDRQAEPGMGAEFLAGRALGVEAVEDRGQLVLAGCPGPRPRP